MIDNTWLENIRIRLRAVEPEDLDVLYNIENDTRFWEHGVTTVPYSHYALSRFICESHQDLFVDGQLRLMIENKFNMMVCGCIDLISFDVRNSRAEVGILVLPSVQRQHIATEAVGLLEDYAFCFLRLHLLYAYVTIGNLPAMRLFHKCGFVKSAVLPDWICRGNMYEEVVVWTKSTLEYKNQI